MMTKNIMANPKTKENLRALCRLFKKTEVELSEKIISEWIATNWNDIEERNKKQLDLFRS